MEYDTVSGAKDVITKIFSPSPSSPYSDASVANLLKDSSYSTYCTANDDPSKYLYGQSARVEIIPETWSSNDNDNNLVMTNEGVVLVKVNDTTVHVYNLFKAYSGTIKSVNTNTENASGTRDIAGKRKILIENGSLSIIKIEGNYYDADADAILEKTKDGSFSIIAKNHDDSMFFGFFEIINYSTENTYYALYYYKPKILLKSSKNAMMSINSYGETPDDPRPVVSDMNLYQDTWSTATDTGTGKEGTSALTGTYIGIIPPSDGNLYLEVL